MAAAAAPLPRSPRRPRPPEDVRLVVADPDDDLASIRTRLARVPGERVALVLPRGSDVFDGQVAMHVLARTARAEAISLAIVSPRPAVRYWAEFEGLKTFRSVSDVPRRVGPLPDDPPTPLEETFGKVVAFLQAQVAWIVALCVVALIIVFGILTIPRADVVLRPVTESITGKVPLQASVDATTVNTAKGIVPGRQVYLVVNASGSTPVTAAQHPLDGFAIGYVTLTNNSKNRLVLPAGTDVSTISGVHFHTTQQAVLDGFSGATAQVPIRAVQPGPGSNVRRGDVQVMEPNFRWVVGVSNPDVVAGGGSPGQPIVTSWETNRLLDQVTNQAQAEARQQLEQQTTAGEIPVPETVEVTPIVESFDHPIGSVANEVTVHVQYRASAMIVNQEQLRALALASWQPKVPDGFEIAPNSITADAPTVVKVSPTSVSFNATLHAVAMESINPDRVVEYVRMRRPADAERDLGKLYTLAAPPSVTVVPDWFGRAFRVNVVVDASAAPMASAAPSS